MPTISQSGFEFQCRTKTAFGNQALDHLPFDLDAMGGSKPMVIQDGAAHQSGLGKILARAFSDSGMTLGMSPPLPGTQGEAALEFIKSLYGIYCEKGFDCIIALGGQPAADAAKALNMAVTLGPESLAAGRVDAPLTPLVYLPTGVGTGTAPAGRADFNGTPFESPFLAPDQVLIDPALLIPDDRETLLDTGLQAFSSACEAFACTNNPPARAYAAAILSLVIPCLKALTASGLSPEDNLKKRKKEEGQWQKNLVQASVLTGYIISKACVLDPLGRAIAGQSRISRGLAMALILPPLLETAPAAGTAALLPHLARPEQFAATIEAQRPAAAVMEIRSLASTLHRISRGRLPRTLEEAGWSINALTALGKKAFETTGCPMDPASLDLLLTCAGTGRSAVAN